MWRTPGPAQVSAGCATARLRDGHPSRLVFLTRFCTGNGPAGGLGRPPDGYLYAFVMAAVSSLMPGPIVVLSETPFRYTPLAAAGLALMMTSSSALTLSCSFFASNEALPMGACTMPAFSTRNSTLPAFVSRTGRAPPG